MYLLDTNVVSELRRPKPHPGVIAWLAAVADADLHLSAVTIEEIQAGIEITREQDADKAASIESWLEKVEQTYNVLPMDARAFRRWARLLHRKSDDPLDDAMIAATAQIHNLTVVTRDVRDFGKTIRHRRNRGGNRRANAALYRVAVVRMRRHPPTRADGERRTAEGRSPREIRRCFKRDIAREIFNHLGVQRPTTVTQRPLTNTGASTPWPRASSPRSKSSCSAAPLRLPSRGQDGLLQRQRRMVQPPACTPRSATRPL